jgi:hypothetical protein
MKKPVLSFREFINESYNKVYEDEKPETNEVEWDFNFDSGKFLKKDISEEALKKIESDFRKGILPIMKSQDYIGQRLNVTLIASTSKVPLGPNAKSALKEAGYTDLSNTGLAKARLETLEEILEDLLFKYLALKTEEKEAFLTNVKNKVKITKKPKPNQGPEYKSGDDKDSEEFKKYQKISSTIDAEGEKIEEDRKVSCNKTTSGKGGKGTSENFFAGYDKNVYIIAKAGDVMTINFDPLVIPDSFLYKYNDDYSLSPFCGSLGGIVTEPYNEAAFNKAKADAESGNGIMPEKRNIDNKFYIVKDYKKAINEIYNKGNALVNAINARIKKLGIKGDIKSLQPNFFDAQGKIEVYSTYDLSKYTATSDNKTGLNTAALIKAKKLPMPTLVTKKDVTITVKKTFVKDSLDMIVFSPCSGTSFNLEANCGGEVKK